MFIMVKLMTSGFSVEKKLEIMVAGLESCEIDYLPPGIFGI